MNKSQDELERIINDLLDNFTFHAFGRVLQGENKKYYYSQFKDRFLSTGYVKLSDVELDEMQIRRIIAKIYNVTTITIEQANLAYAIAEAKDEIIKITKI